jgi:signal transduction histidine kinase
LQRKPLEIEEARQAVSRIANDVDRAAGIIERNRSLYRRGTPQRELIDLNEIIRQIVGLLHDAANRHSISIRTELDAALPTTTADRVQLQQVLMNLMLNGIEAMKDESGELSVTSKRTEKGELLILVSDSGIGLPGEEPERIFEAFFTTKPQGTGMGLSISRRIVESHGGRLWASPNTRRGTTFQFTLPNELIASSPKAI